MSEFRKDGGGDFDKSSGARTGSSTAGGSGLDPFGFRASVQASLAVEHKPSADVVDLIQRWRIVEQATRAVRGHVNERLGDHRDLRHLSPTYSLEPGNGRSLLRSTEPHPALDVLISFSLEDLPKRGYPLSAGGRYRVLRGPFRAQGLSTLHERDLLQEGWSIVTSRSLGPEQSEVFDAFKASLHNLEGLNIELGEPSMKVDDCPECGHPLSTTPVSHVPIGVRFNPDPPVPGLRIGARLLDEFLNDDGSLTRRIAHDWREFPSVRKSDWDKGLPSDIDLPSAKGLPSRIYTSERVPHLTHHTVEAEYRMLPSLAYDVEYSACVGCRLIVPDHVMQVGTLRLTVPDHVLRRWLV